VGGAHNPRRDEYLVVWADAAAGFRIRGMRLTAEAAPHPAESQTRTLDDGAGDTVSPDVACDTRRGGYLVVWADGRADVGDVRGRLLDQDAQPLGDSFPIFAGPGNQTLPRLAYSAADDVFLVAWDVRGGTRASARIQMQVVRGDPAAASRLAGVPMDLDASSDPLTPNSVYVDWNAATNRFLVAWTQLDAAGQPFVRTRLLGGDGSPATAAIDLPGPGSVPAVAANGRSGEFLVSYDARVGGDAFIDVRAVIVGRDGAVSSGPFPVAATRGGIPDWRSHAAYSAAADRYLVTFTRGRSCGVTPCDDVVARAVGPDGALGPELAVAATGAVETHGTDDGFGSWGDLVPSGSGPRFLELFQIAGTSVNAALVAFR
jgi:hypothetical protein